MSKKSPKSNPGGEKKKGGIEKKPTVPKSSKSKESLGDDDFDGPLSDEDVPYDRFDDEDEDDF